MLKKSIVKNFHSIVGEENTLLETQLLESYSVDNLVPQAVLFPATVEHVSEIMKLATKESLSVVPMGSGTKISLGNKPVGVDIVVSTKNLNRIIEHGAPALRRGGG